MPASQLRSVIVFATVLLTALGCKHILESQDPGRARLQLLPTAYTYGPCEASWQSVKPAVKRTIVDFHFPPGGNGPTPDQLAAVEQAGGVVKYSFNVPVVRAEMDVDSVPRLVRSLGRMANPYFAVTVADTSRHFVELIVELEHSLTADDIAGVEALGGSIELRCRDGYLVRIDDAEVPRVRALAGTKLVAESGIGCGSAA